MDYKTYKMTALMKCKYGLLYLLLFIFLGRLFYGSLLAGLPGLLLIPLALRKKAAQLADKRRHELALEFKELVLAYANALRAGYSVENAFLEAAKEIAYLFDEDALIMQECRQMAGKMKNGHSIEELLTDLGRRSGSEDIADFAAVFSVAKRSGGNMPAIMSDTAGRISEKVSLTEEISLMFAQKRLEQRMMDVLPLAIMLYISIASPGYFSSLYGNVTGIVVMTVCLAVYVAAYLISGKIMDIRI
ncbi:MAG: type II secretion system F family protein [Lachnospiraceae bacterium]|nr:type II secretion system F family protein [Lachnospiraceae bacterium]